MQSVALHIVAFMVLRDYCVVGCCVISDDMTMLEAQEECELLRSHNCLTCYLYKATGFLNYVY